MMKEMNFEGIVRTINCVWRFYQMRQQARGFMRGMGAGLVAGAAIAAVSSRRMKNDRAFRRRSDKTMRAIGELFGNMQDIFH